MRSRSRSLLWLAVGVGTAVAVSAMQRQRRTFALRGKTVLITGGARGLGLEMARLFAQEGARLALCARDLDSLKRAEDELKRQGAEVFILPGDVTERDTVTDIVHSVQERFGAIDVLINNAGVIEVGPMEEMRLEDYEEAMSTHFWAPLYASLAVLPQMRQRRSGRIVNIASIGGKVSVPHLLPYSASKFALVGLSEGMRAELIKDNVYVTTVCPGLMRTGSHVNATFKGQNQTEFALFSTLDSLPIISIDARKAARRILTACKRGEAELILSFTAQAAEKFHALFPGTTTELLGQVNRILPGPGGIGKGRATGEESRSQRAPSFLTSLSDQAARRNNELPSAE